MVKRAVEYELLRSYREVILKIFTRAPTVTVRMRR